MKYIIALTAALLLNAPARAEDFRLSFPGVVGRLTVKSEIKKSGKGVRIIATATNESGVPIRKVLFCIRNRKAKPDDCAGRLWNKDVWLPGVAISWEETLQKPVKPGAYEIGVALLVQDDPKYNVRRLYVAPLVGSSSDMVRDQLNALIVNSNYFTLAEDQTTADATLAGRAETREVGTDSFTSGRAATSGGILGSRVAAIAGTASNSTSQGITKTIFEERIVLRLTFNGDSIWAWDDTKPCSPQVQKAKCAVDDLVEALKPPFVPSAIR